MRRKLKSSTWILTIGEQLLRPFHTIGIASTAVHSMPYIVASTAV